MSSASSARAARAPEAVPANASAGIGTEAAGDVLDRLTEVVADGLRGARGLPLAACVEDLAVLAIQSRRREVVLGVDVQVRAGRVAERLDHLHEPGPPGERVQPRVEAQVELQ